jgi:hypothetical protein
LYGETAQVVNFEYRMLNGVNIYEKLPRADRRKAFWERSIRKMQAATAG